MKKWFILLSVLAGVGAALYFSAYQKQVAVPPADVNAAVAPLPEVSKASERRSFVPLPSQQFKDALDQKDYARLRTVMLELLNPKYRRASAIKMLADNLDGLDPETRFHAAWILSKLGSKLGFPVLQELLKDAAQGKVPGSLAAQAGRILHQFRENIDGDTLYKIFLQSKDEGVLFLMELEEAPQLSTLIATWRRNNAPIHQAGKAAAFLGLNDETSVSEYQKLSTWNTQNRVLGQWGLYKATGDSAYLQLIIDSALKGHGVRAGGRDLDELSSSVSLDVLTWTVTPDARNALREMADFSYRQEGSPLFSQAFAALFYLHRDYEYVDAKLESFYGEQKFNGDNKLMIRVAAARNQEKINRLAAQRNPDGLERERDLARDSPVETWIGYYLTRIPKGAFRSPEN